MYISKFNVTLHFLDSLHTKRIEPAAVGSMKNTKPHSSSTWRNLRGFYFYSHLAYNILCLISSRVTPKKCSTNNIRLFRCYCFPAFTLQMLRLLIRRMQFKSTEAVKLRSLPRLTLTDHYTEYLERSIYQVSYYSLSFRNARKTGKLTRSNLVKKK